MKDLFNRFATAVSCFAGHPLVFSAAVLIIVLWSASGPLFGFSDTWQLIINTGTTIVTFLMVFLIQHTQNRDTMAIHLKLDELIRANKAARNALIDLEEASDDELESIRSGLHAARRAADNKPEPKRQRGRRTDAPGNGSGSTR